MGAWTEVKEARAKQLGRWVCEVCGVKLTPRTAVGHHIRHKSSGGKSCLSNCELRCRKCEDADPHYYQGRKGRKSHDYNKNRYDEMRVWRFYCRTGRL